MHKFNISKPEKYVKDGVEKTYWANIGTMTEFTKSDGSISRILEIPAISLKANIFPIENKEGVIQTEPIKKMEVVDISDDSGDQDDEIPF